jgi:tRNA (cmo5U34)-methyltransferase
MGAFFDARIDSYEDHMKGLVYASFYLELARLIPVGGALRLLDLGCGTGLELDEIFLRNPDVQVTGIDLSEKMLARLWERHAARVGQLDLIRGDYFSYGYPPDTYDFVVSAESLHHFAHEEKLGLYRKVLATLKPGGHFIELDYVAADQAAEDAGFAEKERRLAEAGVTEGMYHIDTPCTVENEVRLLREAGFGRVDIVRYEGSTLLLDAVKEV